MKLEACFKNLIKEGRLAQSYLFWGFGEGQIDFILSLVNFLENKKWEPARNTLLDSLIFEEKDFGIEAVRKAQQFLWQKPARSLRKSLVIGQAGVLTSQAQTALLKIVEEPPSSALILLAVNDPSLFPAALTSRFQKIYFSGILNKDKVSDEAKEFLKGGAAKRTAIIKKVIEDDQLLSGFIRSLFVELDREPFKNYYLLRELLKRWTLISQWNTNKKLQLEAFSQWIK